MKKHNIYSIFMVTLAVLALTSACSGQSSQNQPSTTTLKTNGASSATEAGKREHARARMVNTLPGQSIDAFANDRKTFANLSYKMVSSYQALPDSQVTFRVRPAGQDQAQPLAEYSERLGQDDSYTVVVLPGFDTQATLRVLNDNLIPPLPGKALVRVIHAAPEVGPVDLYMKGYDVALFHGVNFQAETRYPDIDPMSGTVEVRPAGQPKALLTIANMNFKADKAYTIIITGRAKGKLEAIKIEDQFPDGMKPSST